MSNTLQDIESDILQLPEDQRVTLAHRILMSAEPVPNSTIDDLWETEIARRIEYLDSGRTERHSAACVFEELDQRCGTRQSGPGILEGPFALINSRANLESKRNKRKQPLAAAGSFT